MSKKTKDAPKPPPPPHLSRNMKAFWISVFEIKHLQRYEVEIFLQACEAHDRCEQARRILKKEGLTFTNRFNQPTARPEIAIELSNRALFAKLLGGIRLREGELHPW
jgi:phage terminase small subunit